MKARELDELRAIEDRHPWFRARRRALAPLVEDALAAAPPGPWLDLGAGTGANLVHLAPDSNRRRLALDRSARALAHLVARTGARDVRTTRADAEALPFASGSLACVTALDLLEHIDDDACLREIARVLQPAGAFVVSVPAWPSLWSRHDQLLGHRRRYRPRDLSRVLRRHGFTIRATRPFVCSALPLVALVRSVLRRPLDAPPLDASLDDAPGARTDFGWLGGCGTRLLDLSLRLDELAARVGRLPFGLSVLVACERAQDARWAARIARTSSSGISAGTSPAASLSERPAAIVAR